MTTKKPKKEVPAKVEMSLVLRVCRADFTSHGGFKWPSEVGSSVEASDWKQNQNCGNGLHGWLFGHGDVGCVDHWAQPDSKWFVLEVESSTIITLGGKVKFPRAVVRFIGGREEAAAFLLANEPRAKAENCIGHVIQVGEGQVAATGSLGTATAGDRGTATAGYRGTATAGDRGTATAGDSGTATAGDSGTATAGDRGEIRIRWYDTKNDRYRTEIAYVGESGIKPNVKYRLDEQHKFVEVKE